MKCKEAEERLEAFVLGALDSREMDRVRHHVDTCPECGIKLSQHSNIAADLALAVPQLEAPLHMKSQLLSRVEAAAARGWSKGILGRWADLWPKLGWRLATHGGMVAAPALVLIMVLGGFWFNNRLTDIAEDRDALANKIEIMAEDEAEMKQMVKDQRSLIYASARPSLMVNMLPGTNRWPEARGMVLVPMSGEASMLAALDLPPLPKDKTYQVWLIAHGRMYSAGTFSVDETGYVQTRIDIPMVPLRTINPHEIDGIVITVEQAGGSPGPTGESVLRGDL